MPRKLPPAGNRAPTARWNDSQAHEYLSGQLAPYAATFLSSGTAALALAISLAKVRRARPSDEVIMPAYACPDLIAAVLCAGCRPRLVDVEAEQWQYSEPALAKAVNQKTLAVLAVDLLGLGDDCTAARAAAETVDAALIQDSAQSIQPRAVRCWQADYVILSFSRGKPINLLGGGALLLKRNEDQAQLRQLVPQSAGVSEPLRQLKVLAFNELADPRTYWAVSALAFGVGQTRYRPLEFSKIRRTDRSRILAPAWQQCVETSCTAQTALDRCLIGGQGVHRLPGSLGHAEGARLLRYPILARDRSTRDRIVRALGRLGASPFYGRPLPAIRGIPDIVREQGPFPGAQALADRLLTLPLHDRVSSRDVALMCEQLDAIAGAAG
jgi:dTDP-4-amino-4,6-dideoxygalactose transaminase